MTLRITSLNNRKEGSIVMTKTRTLLFLLSALLLFAAGSALAESAEEPVIHPILQEEDNISLPEGMDLTQYS